MSVTKAQLVGGVGLSTVGDLTVYGGLNVTGVVTASSFVGNLTGTASTATASATSFGLSGTPNITVGFITATGASISGNVNVGGNVSIAGTLTYEDVTNVDSIGIVTARAGIVLGPTSNTIQLGTGTTISSPASDTFTISTNGGERVRVDSSGRLGLGTSAPQDILHLSNAGNLYLRITNSSTGINAYLGQDSNGTYIGNTGSADVRFIQGASERMRLTSTGLGVNNTSPSESLHVTGNILASGNVTGYSDETLKDNVQTIPDALDKVIQLRGVEYDRNDIEGNPRHIGMIAQEIEKVIPEVVTTHENGIKSVAYGNLVGLLIEAIKDLKEEVNELKARLEEV